MYKQCVSEKAAAQQRKFEEALLQIMKTVPFEHISISELCRQAGLSRKTFYRLYQTKGDVVYAMIDHAILDAEGYEPSPDVGQGGMHAFFGFWQSKKELLDVLAKNQISSLLSQQAVLHLMKEEPDIVRCFGADNPENRREKLLFYVSGLFALVLDWHNSGFWRSVDEMAKLAMELFMTPPVKAPRRADPYREV